jgi:ribosomal protein RSM22 (predicted rRNA methylase)
MTWSVPAAIEDALWEAARRQLPPELIGGAGLTAAVVDRSRRYTSDRDRLAQPASPLADLAARALFFTVVDAAKIHLPLAELARRGLIPPRPLRLLDVGAGCGAMTLGALAPLAAAGVPSLEAMLVDRDRAALAIAAAAVAEVARTTLPALVTTSTADVTALAPSARFDLIVAGTVFNELPAAARLPLVSRLLAALAPDGALVIVEPALRTTTRDLHVLRDQILDGGLAHVFAPCTRRGAPCPMLADERDWCHEERPLDLPQRAGRIAHTTGLRDGAMKMAYLVLRHGPEGQVDGQVDGAAAAERVVSQPLGSKGKHEVYVCGDSGRVRLRLLSRARTPANREVERARRGDVLILPAAALDDGDVGKDMAVERLALSGD